MAITTDMIKYGMNTLYNDDSLHSHAIRTALVTGYCLLMHISEYIVVPSTKHHLLGSSLLFGISDVFSPIKFDLSHHQMLINMSLYY